MGSAEHAGYVVRGNRVTAIEPRPGRVEPVEFVHHQHPRVDGADEVHDLGG